MRYNVKLTAFFFLFINLLVACKKNNNEACRDAYPPTAGFVIMEILNDTAFIADTVFGSNWILFETTRPYDTVTWKIGNNPNVFTKPKFEFNFGNNLGTIDVDFTARAKPNTMCYPNDNGIYSGKKRVTIVEKFDKATLTISPMVGHYKGAYKEAPTDTFSVTINYFDSAKYNPTFTGTKNFYWISNIPNKYEDLTSIQARYYPELRKGMGAKMGYKCLQFGNLGDGKKGEGRAELKHDTLFIYYLNALTGRNTFIGKRQ